MRWINWVLVCCLLAGCNAGVSITSVILPTATTTFLPLIKPTNTPNPTQPPTATVTLTPTTTLTPASTLTPLAISPDSRVAIWRLLVNNGGCHLPCFWGITPGKTSLAEFLQFVHQFPQEAEWMEKYEDRYMFYYDPPLRNIDTTFGVMFYAPNSTIDVIILDSGTARLTFPLTRLLQENGMPDKVLIGPQQPLSGDNSQEMFVVYEKQKILVRYYLVTKNEYLCYDPKLVNRFQMWGGNENWLTYLNLPFGDSASDANLYPIDQMTEYDMETFYKQFSTRNRSICMKMVEEKP